ncbi:sulfatase [Draconibacterium sp.]|uniref:sulfatase n=1 Tax=Draconibacterium sp. TaxID=1965318 RepID=UPI0035666C4C
MNKFKSISFWGMILSLAVAFAFTQKTHNSNVTQSEVQRPNIILIVADDLGYADLSCYGSKTINTPNLDKLAAEGIRFTDFHSNGPVCSPTRAALLTGKYQQRVGIDGVVTAKHDRHKGLAPNEKTFAETFKEAGYVTGMFGKWHVGYETKFNPINQGFDEYIGFVSGNVDYHSHVDQEGYEDWWTGDKLVKEEGYSTDLITRHSVDFIKRHKEEPFLLYIPHEAPHGPFQGRNSKPQRKVREQEGADFIINPPEENRAEIYKEMVEVMDEGIGVVLNTLKELNLDKNTFVFFCSDNGGTSRCGDNGKLRGYKASLWEGGHRVTAIAWYPGVIAPNQINDETLLTMDLYPTLAEMIGAEIPQNIDGVSIKNHLLKGEDMPKRDLFWGYAGRAAMRRGDWKLMLSKPDAEPMLYNLKSDLEETNNVANENRELVKEMLVKLNTWKKEVKSEK